jgi:hypothetical protein
MAKDPGAAVMTGVVTMDFDIQVHMFAVIAHTAYIHELAAGNCCMVDGPG